MLICLENLIDPATVTRLRDWLAGATFEDGRATAGGNARLVKRNEQVSDDPNSRDPRLEEMQELVEDLLWHHEPFMIAAQPSRIKPPLFSRYLPGMSYGTHMDNALMGEMRVDLSLTLFLSEPSDYDGGELIIDFSTGARAIKLPAGSGILYATTAPHRVAEVTRGQRLAVVTWVRSLVRDPADREILLDLKTAQRQLSSKLGKTPEIDLLGKAYTNLLRRWIED
jgi:PKHD-type hydroxylase